MPAPDFGTNNLKLLSIEQALADVVTFLDFMNGTLPPGPWIVFGCSYAGGLAAWFRSKFPNLVIGGVSASGVVVAESNLTSYFAQFPKDASTTCLKAIQKAVPQIQQMISTSQGRNQLQSMFNTCTPIMDDPKNQYSFLLTISGALGYSAQSDNPPDFITNQLCEMMSRTSQNSVQNWADVVKYLYGEECLSFDESWIKEMQDKNSLSRAWFFQMCTQYGYFKPCYGGDTGCPFFPNLHLEHQLEWCEIVFDIHGMKPNTEWVNSYYGGYDLQATNLLFTNGLFDPWHNISILKNQSGILSVTYEAAHCAPFLEETSKDPISLIHARQSIADFVTRLIKT